MSPETLRESITPETTLVSIMLANNETGTLNHVGELAEVAHEAGVPFHTDAAQALGKVPVDVEMLGVDLMSLSAHKCYGPKGTGALYVRRRPRRGLRRVRPTPLLHGGGQERGLRSGTLNVPGIVGFGRAAALATDALPEEAIRVAGLRDKFWEGLSAGVPVVADMPFASYASAHLATENGTNLVRAGARALKLEGAGHGSLQAVRALVEMGVPMVGHLGFTPQSSLKFEGVVQGKNVDAAAKLLEEAQSLEAAGCCALVLEAMPAEVAQRITGELAISTIGIGAGLHCDAQVLVWHDLVGLNPDPPLRFVKRYAEANALLKSSTEAFVSEVRSGAFPRPEHAWAMDGAERAAWESRENGESARRGKGDR